MKLSTKSRYALRSIIEVANAKATISISEISKHQDISERYLELIFAKLKKASIINSIRGSHGGYQLAKSPKHITVYDIIKAMENDPKIIKSHKKNDAMSKMLKKEVWTPVDKSLELYLKRIKISDLL